MPLLGSLEEARRAEAVVDLSDEPVLGPRERMLLGEPGARARAARTSARTSASTRPRSSRSEAAVARGDRNRQADREDGRHWAPRPAALAATRRRRRLDGPRRPSRARARRGRADAGRAARALARGRARGLRLPGDRRARRRADDRLPPRGRRARGRRSFTSNVRRGRELAEERGPELVVFDGSGAAIPPVAVDGRDPRRRAGAGRDRLSESVPRARLGPRPADGRRRGGADPRAQGRAGDPGRASAAARRAARREAGRSLHGGPRTGRPPRRRGRARLAEPRRPRRAARGAGGGRRGAYLVEIKAAAIDVVAEAAVERGVEVVFAANDVRPLEPSVDLDAELLSRAPRSRWPDERAPANRSDPARRRGRAVLEGADGPRADARRRLGRSRVRGRAARRAGPARAQAGLGRARPGRGARRGRARRE